MLVPCLVGVKGVDVLGGGRHFLQSGFVWRVRTNNPPASASALSFPIACETLMSSFQRVHPKAFTTNVSS